MARFPTDFPGTKKPVLGNFLTRFVSTCDHFALTNGKFLQNVVEDDNYGNRSYATKNFQKAFHDCTVRQKFHRYR